MVNSRLKKLATYLRPHWRMVVFGIVALLVVNAVGVYIPLLIKDIIDELKTGFSFRDLSDYALLLLVLASGMWGNEDAFSYPHFWDRQASRV